MVNLYYMVSNSMYDEIDGLSLLLTVHRLSTHTIFNWFELFVHILHLQYLIFNRRHKIWIFFYILCNRLSQVEKSYIIKKSFKTTSHKSTSENDHLRHSKNKESHEDGNDSNEMKQIKILKITPTFDRSRTF